MTCSRKKELEQLGLYLVFILRGVHCTKKANFDPADPKSYRPIANLSVLSKLLERLVARQLVNYLNAARLLPDLQSAYRAHHSTETAVTKVLSDILTALDTGDIGMLTLLTCQPRSIPSTTTYSFAV